VSDILPGPKLELTELESKLNLQIWVQLFYTSRADSMAKLSI